MSDKPQKQAIAKAAWATFSTNTCRNYKLMYTAIVDGEKYILFLCAWKVDFPKSSYKWCYTTKVAETMPLL